LRAVHDQLCEAAPVRLTGLDTAGVCQDRDVTPMHLGALATFRPADVQRLAEAIEPATGEPASLIE
jgi:hypothetical protein